MYTKAPPIIDRTRFTVNILLRHNINSSYNLLEIVM